MSVVVILLSIPSITPSRMMDAAKFLLWPSVDVIVSDCIGKNEMCVAAIEQGG